VRRNRNARGVGRYLSDDWSDETLPVNVFLVEHAQGLCLFDTGQTARAADSSYFSKWYPFFRLARFELTADEEAAAQLRRLGHDPATVRWIVLSHLHTDHVGGLDSFPQAEVFVARSEWESARGLAGRLRGYLPQYWPRSAKVRLVDFTGPPIGPFPASHDLVGDGELLLVPAEGHTRGHMAMLVRNGLRSFLLAGDAAMSAAEAARSAPALARFCQDTGAVFLASHDADAAGLITSTAAGGQ
jgi:N-acyl homoserine lactone hydrolase